MDHDNLASRDLGGVDPGTVDPGGVDLGGLTDDGYVVLPAFLDAAEIADALDELSVMYPTAAEFHDGNDRGVRSRFEDGQGEAS